MGKARKNHAESSQAGELRRRAEQQLRRSKPAEGMPGTDVRALINELQADQTTAHKQAEEDLAWLARLPGENPNPVLCVDGDGAILYSNQAGSPLLAAWGCRERRAVSGRWQQCVLDAIASGRVQQVECECGRQVFALAFAPMPESGYVNVYGLDITDRKRAEEALSKGEERFRLAMDATSDGLWEWDIATGQTYYSPAYSRMLGYEPGELASTSRTWVDLIHPDDRARVLAVNQECIDNRREAFQVDYRMRSKDGRWRWILGRGKATRRDPGGKALFMVGTHLDITDRKQAEEDLRRSEAQLSLTVYVRFGVVSSTAASVCVFSSGRSGPLACGG